MTKNDSSDTDIAKLSADKLMGRFRKSSIVTCLFLAFALHVVVLGSTSVDYIHGLFDPAWKAEQDRLADEAKAAKAAAKRTPAPAPVTRPAKPVGPKPAPPTGPNGRPLPPELTTMPGPGEIPGAPGGGIGIDETVPR